MYKKITNPMTGKKVSIYGKRGQAIIKNYMNIINQQGGFIRGGVRMPVDNYLDTNVSCNTQKGGFIRGGVRMPVDNYLDTNVSCNTQKGGFIRGGVRMPIDNYLDTNVSCNTQKGGFIRGGVRMPVDNYLDTNVSCNTHKGGFIRGGVRMPVDNYLDTNVSCNTHKGGAPWVEAPSIVGGRKAYADHNYAEAAKLFKDAKTDDPTNVEAWYWMAESVRMRDGEEKNLGGFWGDIDTTASNNRIGWLLKVLELDPTYSYAKRDLGIALKAKADMHEKRLKKRGGGGWSKWQLL